MHYVSFLAKLKVSVITINQIRMLAEKYNLLFNSDSGAMCAFSVEGQDYVGIPSMENFAMTINRRVVKFPLDEVAVVSILHEIGHVAVWAEHGRNLNKFEEEVLAWAKAEEFIAGMSYNSPNFAEIATAFLYSYARENNTKALFA